MNDQGQVDGSPEFVRFSINKALKRLDIPFVDLFYVHRLDEKTPIETTMGELKKIKEEGLIKYIGLSECSSDSLRRACKVEHVDAVQIEYSPFSLDIESDQIGLLKTCRELGVAVVCYSPIGRGMLGGHIRSKNDFDESDFRRHAPRFSDEVGFLRPLLLSLVADVQNFPKNLELVDKLTAIAKKKGTTASALTLAWLLAQGDDIFPIPGTTNIGRLEENLSSLKIKLSKEEEQEIRHACENAEISGGRYPEAYAKGLFADTVPLKA
jgi:aryl-alcohol dehydrogenase-like predicted oxidoreductase